MFRQAIPNLNQISITQNQNLIILLRIALLHLNLTIHLNQTIHQITAHQVTIIQLLNQVTATIATLHQKIQIAHIIQVHQNQAAVAIAVIAVLHLQGQALVLAVVLVQEKGDSFIDK